MVSPIDIDKYVHNKLLDDENLTILFDQLQSKNDGKINALSTLIRNLYFNRREVWASISRYIIKYVQIIPQIQGPKIILNHLKNIKDFYVEDKVDYSDSFDILVDSGFIKILAEIKYSNFPQTEELDKYWPEIYHLIEDFNEYFAGQILNNFTSEPD